MNKRTRSSYNTSEKYPGLAVTFQGPFQPHLAELIIQTYNFPALILWEIIFTPSIPPLQVQQYKTLGKVLPPFITNFPLHSFCLWIRYSLMQYSLEPPVPITPNPTLINVIGNPYQRHC